jgi:hypothetical protein
LESTSTPRSKKSIPFAAHHPPLMTPPPTPQKPKPKPQTNDGVHAKHASKVDKPVEAHPDKKTKRSDRRQAARAADPANNSQYKSLKRKSVTFEEVVQEMDEIVQRSASHATSAPSSPPTPTPVRRTRINTQIHIAAIDTYDSEAVTADLESLESLLSSSSFPQTHTSRLLSPATEFLLAIRAEQSCLCEATDALELAIKELKASGVKNSSEMKRLEEMLELTVELGSELVLEEGGFRDVCGNIWEEGWGLEGEVGWSLEEEFGGMKMRVKRCVEEFDGRMEVLRGGD